MPVYDTNMHAWMHQCFCRESGGQILYTIAQTQQYDTTRQTTNLFYNIKELPIHSKRRPNASAPNVFDFPPLNYVS